METVVGSGLCRKEKRKVAKKLKRKQTRKEIALKEREEEEARSNDLEELQRLRLKEQEEAEILEKQRKEFEERERLWIEKTAKEAEEEAQRKLLEEESQQRKQVEHENELNEDDTWEYVEEGPAEIIWQGNEIIVKKKRVRVPKKSPDQRPSNADADRPTSNPLPPQSEAFASYKNTSVSAQQVFESVSQQIPNFGTEQDKAHCPFHIKTGACRFGSRCSRVHFYPDKSCTMLIKNMYNGPGLAWEQDEGLEYTDEEVERCYEEFYEDVHTEFLKFGEIVNFKVCKNGSFHLRGNVYVHYKSLESAILAYHSINGRYFAGKQITCEFVGVTRWKVAICGEYMKSRLKTCSHGTACNFIHCFRNPGGDYEWADWDNPPPKYWVKKMAALFGPSDEAGYDKHRELEGRRQLRNSGKKITAKWDSFHSRRSRSRDVDCLNSSSGEDHSDENRARKCRSSSRQIHSSISRKKRSFFDEQGQCEENSNVEDDRYDRKHIARDHDSGGDYSDKDRDRHNSHSRTRSSCPRKGMDSPDDHGNLSDYERYKGKDRLHSHDSRRRYSDVHRVQSHNHSSRREHSTRQIKEADFLDEHHTKSDKKYESDSPGRYDGGHESHDRNSGHTGENMEHTDQSSGGHYNENRPGCRNQSSHRTCSNSREEETDSSDVDHESKENHNHKQERKNKGKSNNEQEEASELSPYNVSVLLDCRVALEESDDRVADSEDTHHSRKHGSSRREKHRRKKKHENREDETSNLGAYISKQERASRKRSRSRSTVHCPGG